MVKYSICVSHFNNIGTVEKSLESILNQIDNDYEIIVVDSLSNDGSEKILQKYKELGKIQLIEVKCSRGRARQIGFEHSQGDYIIANMDMDDLFAPNLKRLCGEYHNRYEGFMLRVRRSPHNNKELYTSITIAPRSMISHLGGWNDLNWWEDVDLWRRAREEGKFIQISFPILLERGHHQERHTLFGRIVQRYRVYRNGLMMGKGKFEPNRKQIIIYLIAKIDVSLRKLRQKGLGHKHSQTSN